MDSIYRALLSSSQTLLEQLGRSVEAEQADFGPFWILLDEQREVRVGDERRLDELVDDIASIDWAFTRVDDGLEPVICPVEDGVVAIGHLGTERTHCGYAMLALPGYTADTAQANMGLIEMLLVQMNLLAGAIEKNNQLHHDKLSRLSKQSGMLSSK